MKHVAVAIATTTILAVGLFLAPPAQAAMVTIFPNYSDGWCAGSGSVRQVNVAGVPGNSTISPMGQRWARLQVVSPGQVKIIAQLLCVSGNARGGAWRTAVRDINDPVAWKSYYF
jgi:hypothetical protein